jgi:hypothetical protein
MYRADSSRPIVATHKGKSPQSIGDTTKIHRRSHLSWSSREQFSKSMQKIRRPQHRAWWPKVQKIWCPQCELTSRESHVWFCLHVTGQQIMWLFYAHVAGWWSSSGWHSMPIGEADEKKTCSDHQYGPVLMYVEWRGRRGKVRWYVKTWASGCGGVMKASTGEKNWCYSQEKRLILPGEAQLGIRVVIGSKPKPCRSC